MDAKKRLILRGICAGLGAIFKDESVEISLDTDTDELTSLQLMGVENPVMRAVARKHKAIIGACVASGKRKKRKLVHVIYKVLEEEDTATEEDEELEEEKEQEDEEVEEAVEEEVPQEEPCIEKRDPMVEPEQLAASAPKIAILDQYTAALNDMDFKANYGLSRSTVRWVIDRCADHLVCRKKMGRPPTSSDINILLSLWTLTHRESFRIISERYGVGIGHAHRVFVCFCRLLAEHRADYIAWPEAPECGDGFPGDVFPGVVGSVDVTAIMFRTLKGTEAYRNRRGQHCVLLQAVCDSSLRFVDISVGCPGSCSDGEVWRSSPLGMQLEEGPTDLIPDGMHLLGDRGYPLREYLLVPYGGRCLSVAQQHFNDRLNARKAEIGRALGRLKGRFERLQFFDALRTDLVSVVVSAACVLHNVCIDLGDDCPEFEADDYEGEEASDTEEEEEDEFGLYFREMASQKRDRICTQLADEL